MGDEAIIRLNRNGVPSVHGTRLTVYSIMDHYFTGAEISEISEFYRIDNRETVAAIQYINSHMNELMPLYRQMLHRDAQGNSSATDDRFREAHDNLIELQAKLKGHSERVENAPVTR